MELAAARALTIIPPDWRECMAVIAHTFHFAEGELWSMTPRRLRFWHERAAWLADQIKRQAGS